MKMVLNLFKTKSKKKTVTFCEEYKNRKNSRSRSESGNIFFTLFGAVALVGVVGAASTSMMRGPVKTVVTLNQRAKADTQMQIAARLALLSASEEPDSGDCDADGFVEPLDPDTTTGACSTLGLTGGGCLNANIGASRQDPWGTMYGYCAWDHGPSTAACSGALTNVRTGEDRSDRVVIAIISAGPDRAFQASCLDATGYVNESVGSDDIVLTYNYEEASENVDGLWRIQSGDPDTAEIAKNIDVQQEARFQSRASFSAGSELDLSLGGLLSLPDQNAVPNCIGANDGVLRINNGGGSNVLQICDDLGGNGWVNLGGVGGVTAAGSASELQFRNSSDGTLAADADLQWDGSSLGVGGAPDDDTVEITGTLGVSAGAEINGNVSASDGTLEIASNLDITGSGTLTVGGESTFNGNVDINGASTLTVDGVATFENFSNFNGNVNVNGASTLTVGGITTLNNILNVTGQSNLEATEIDGNLTANDGTLEVASNLTLTGTNDLTVGGESTFNGNVDVTGANTLTVGGLSTFNGNVDITGTNDLTVGGTTTLGLTVINNNVSATDGAVDFTSNIEVTSGYIRATGTASQGGACSNAGAIQYNSSDETLLVCTDGNWETIGASGGGGTGVGGKWSDGTNPPDIVYTSGDVGIGTADPEASLHVVGDLLAQGAYTGTATVPVTGTGTRLFFDPESAAFRAGGVTGTQWDSASIGNYSVGLGLNTTANGDRSFAGGQLSGASGAESFAYGYDVSATANQAIALGFETSAAAANSVAIGLGDPTTTSFPTVTGARSFAVFMGDQQGVDLQATETFALLGGRMLLDQTPAANPAVSGTLTLDVEGDLGAVQYCNEDGSTCIDADVLVGGTSGITGNDTEIFFNDNGNFGTDPLFVFDDATTRFGLGTTSPEGRLHVHDVQYDLGTGNCPTDYYNEGDYDGEGDAIDCRLTGLYVSDDQLVGIGHTNPTAALHINSNNPDIYLSWSSNPSDTRASIQIGGSSVIEGRRTDGQMFITSTSGISMSGQELAFGTDGSRRLTITETGEIGIGDEDPDLTLLLDVEGQVGAAEYCDEAGLNCFEAETVANNLVEELDDLLDATTDYTSGSENIFLGQSAGSTSAGLRNIILGVEAGNAIETTSADNVIIGDDAAKSSAALRSIIIGSDAVGAGASSVEDSIIIGREAGEDFEDVQSIFLGTGASQNNEGDDRSVVIGYQAAANSANTPESTGMGSNVVIGHQAGMLLHDSSQSVILGAQAGKSITTGDGNIVLGYNSGSTTLATGGDNILIGNGLDTPAGATNNYLNIGNILFGDMTTSSEKIGAYSYCDETLGSCFTASDIATVTGGGGGLFERSGTLVRPKSPVVIADDDFVFGSDRLANDTGGTDDDARFFFDKSKAAFRAGVATGAQWDDTNVGFGSAAFGWSTIASGGASFAAGESNTVTGAASFVMGKSNTVNANYAGLIGEASSIGVNGSNSILLGTGSNVTENNAIALGTDVNVSQNYSMAIGLGDASAGTNPTVSGASSLGIFMGDQQGVNLSDANTVSIMGASGGVGIGRVDPRTELEVVGRLTLETSAENNIFINGGNTSFSGGGSNIAIGNFAGSGLTSGFDNVMIGPEAGSTVNSGDTNILIGRNSGGANGSSSTVVGHYTGGGSFNNFFGRHAGENSTGSGNVFMGHQAGTRNVLGTNNVAVGNEALRFFASASGAANVAVGHSALQGVDGSSTGVRNIGIGYQAGNSITTGTDNILIGYDVDTPAATTNNYLNIGNTIYGELDTDFVGIGVADPTVELDIGGTGAIKIPAGNNTTERPSSPENGMMRYNSTDNIFEVYQNGSWTGFVTAASGGGLFERSGTVVRPKSPVVFSSDDFVFGSDQLTDKDDADYDARFQFDKDIAAFAAGTVDSTQWDSLGAGSVSFGTNIAAQGPNSIAIGETATVDAGASNSMILGLGQATGTAPTVSGNNSLGIMLGDQSTVDLSDANTIAIMGASGGIGIGTVTPGVALDIIGDAVQVYNDGGSAYLSLNGSGDTFTYSFMNLVKQSDDSAWSMQHRQDDDGDFLIQHFDGTATYTGALYLDGATHNMGIRAANPAVSLVINGTDAIQIPAGNNTTERPGSPENGMIRYNDTDDQFEFYQDGGWVSFTASGSSIWSDSGSGYIEYTDSLGGIRVASVSGAAAPTSAFTLSLDDITDVDFSSAPGTGDVLYFDGTNWIASATGASAALSGLANAVATNTLANANYAQTWNWDTLTTETAMTLGSTSITGGTLLDVTSSATGMTGTMVDIALSGNNSANNGTLLKSSVSGASSEAVPMMITNLGAGLSFRVNDETGDADTTPFVIDASGAVGIGVASPSRTLDVAGSMVLDTGTNDNVFISGGSGGALVNHSVAIGINALSGLRGGCGTSCNNNTAIGYGAADSIDGGRNNVFLGFNAGLGTGANANASDNVIIGASAATGIEGAANNVIIGQSTGDGLVNGDNNILIGRNIDLASDVSNYMSIGNTIYGELDTDFVGIGVADPTVELDIGGTGAIKVPSGADGERPANAAGLIRFNSDSGAFEGNDGAGWGALAEAGAGGSNTQVQFNNSGSLEGDTAFTWDSGSDTLTVDGVLNVSDKINITGLTGGAPEKLAISDLGEIDFSTPPGTGDILYFDGTNWIANDTGGGDADWQIDSGNNYVYNTADTIGIGTADPDYLLDIGDGTNVRMFVNQGTNLLDSFNLNADTTASNSIEMTIPQGVRRQAFTVTDAANPTDTALGFATSNDSGSTWQPHFVIQQGGNVGIGLNNPSVELEIAGTGAIKIPSGADGDRPANAAGLVRFNSDSGEFEGNDGAGWGPLVSGSSDADWSFDSANNEIYNTTDQVGIGTADPEAPLHVAGTSFPVAKIQRTTGGTNFMASALTLQATSTSNMVNNFGTGITFEINDAGLTSQNIVGRIGAVRDAVDNESMLVFHSGDDLLNMVLDRSGFLGIGTGDPQDPLHIFKPDPDITLSFDGTAGDTKSEIRFLDSNTLQSSLSYDRVSENTIIEFNHDGDSTGSFAIQKNGVDAIFVEPDWQVAIGSNNASGRQLYVDGNTTIAAGGSAQDTSGLRIVADGGDTTAGLIFGRQATGSVMDWFVGLDDTTNAAQEDDLIFANADDTTSPWTSSTLAALDYPNNTVMALTDTGDVLMGGTGAVLIPSGNTAAQPGSPVDGMIRYNSQTDRFEFREAGSWKSFEASTSGSMISGWPDAIVCNVTNPNWGQAIFRPIHMPEQTDGKYYYRFIASVADYQISWNSDGTFDAYQNITASNCNKSISALYSDDQAFDLVGGSGGGGGGSSVWTQNSEDIYYDATSPQVGIGNTSPDYLLDVGGGTDVRLFVNEGDANVADSFNLNADTTASNSIELTIPQGVRRQAFTITDAATTGDTALGFATSNDSGSTWQPHFVIQQGGNVGIGLNNPSVELDISGTGAIKLPVGDDSERPSNAAGLIRYNSEGGEFEGNTGSAWVSLSGGSGLWTDNTSHISRAGDVLVTGTYSGTASVPVTGAGTRMFFDSETAAFRVGQVNGTQWDNASIGNNSFAYGLNTIADGGQAFAGGQFSQATGGESFAMGYAATATDNQSIAMGFEVQTTGANSVAFGLGDASTGSFPVVSGPRSFGIFMGDQQGVNLSDAETFSIMGASGGVGIGTVTPAAELSVVGDIEFTGTITDVSDRRLKTDIKPLEGSMMDKLAKIDTYSFKMKDDETGRTEFGVMAQELEEIFPELVKTADDEMGTKSVNYVGLIAPVIEASKELKAENDALRAELASIQSDIKGLKAHTGFGISRASLEMLVMLILAGMMGGGMVLLVTRRKEG